MYFSRLLVTPTSQLAHDTALHSNSPWSWHPRPLLYRPV